MFFNRKPKNRRLGREFVLDVKLRSGQVRAARVRAVSISCGVAFATLFSLYLVWRGGEWLLTTFLYQNNSFAIQEIEVQTDGVVAPEQLRQWAGVHRGQNLLALDLARVKRDLELAPVIQNASIERVLPHTLRLRITEREPIAQVSVPRQKPGGGIEFSAFYLDAEGYVMLPLEQRQRSHSARSVDEQLPVLVGVNASDLQAGKCLDSPQLHAALQLILAFEHSPMAGLAELSRIDLSTPEVIIVSTEQGTEITFGLHNLDRQLRRWREIFDWSQRVNKPISSMDLAVADNIPVRLFEPSALPPSISKPVRPPVTHRRTHV